MNTNKTITLLITFMMSFLFASGLEVGDSVPDIQAVNQNGKTIDLGHALAEGITLVFFYPKADTPGCTAQACSLRDSFEELVAKGVKVFGVSYDSPEKQTEFIEKYDLPFDLIADEDKSVSKAFDRGLYSRQAYLIRDGEIIWRDLKASTKTQAADVKQALMDLDIMDFPSMH